MDTERHILLLQQKIGKHVEGLVEMMQIVTTGLGLEILSNAVLGWKGTQ